MTSSPPRVVAIIPARGGSQGVPGKNLKTVGGIPLIARAVRTAIHTDSVTEVIVTTDDAAIAAVAREHGARVVDRPEHLAGATASSESALLHALDVLGGAPDILVFIQATSPFIDPRRIDTAVSRVLDHESDVVFAARPSHAFLWRVGESGATGINHEASVRLRRQDAEPQFLETGAFYVMRVAGFRAARHRFFGRIGIEVVDELGSLEIDSEDDLALARALAPLTENSRQETA